MAEKRAIDERAIDGRKEIRRTASAILVLAGIESGREYTGKLPDRLATVMQVSAQQSDRRQKDPVDCTYAVANGVIHVIGRHEHTTSL